MDLHTVTAHEPATAVLEGGSRPADGDVWLAGGTWLFSEPQPRARRLLDLTALGWPPVAEDGRGAHLAATCTVRELVAWAADPARGGRHRAAPLVLACADAFVAGWKVQAVATVGGNVVTALPAAPVVSLAAGLDAVAELWTPDGAGGRAVRTAPVAELVTGDHATSLAPGELLRELVLPAASLAARTASRRASLAPLGRSASLVVGRVDPDGTAVLTLTAATRRPVQLRWPSLAAAGAPGDAAAALDAAVAEDLWHDDVHGHPAWRRAMALRQAAQVVAELAGAAGAPA